MKKIAQLITDAKHSTPKGDDAFVQLVELQKQAFEPIFAAIEKGEDANRLKKILVQIRDPEVVPLLISLLSHENETLVEIALHCLSVFKDPRSITVIVEKLKTSDEYSSITREMISTLGTIVNPEVRNVLLNIALKHISDFSSEIAIQQFIDIAMDPENGDPALIRLIISVSIALARQSEMALLPVIMYISSHQLPEWGGDESALREEATAALKYFCGPQLVSHLKQLSKEKDSGLDYHIITILRYFGTKECVMELLPFIRDKNSDVSGHAVQSIKAIMGNVPELSSLLETKSYEQIDSFLLPYFAPMKDKTCYRMGKPIEISTVIDQIEVYPSTSQIVDELEVITGNNFGYDLFTPTENVSEITKRAKKWLNTKQEIFHSGALIKNGFEQKISVIFDQ